MFLLLPFLHILPTLLGVNFWRRRKTYCQIAYLTFLTRLTIITWSILLKIVNEKNYKEIFFNITFLTYLTNITGCQLLEKKKNILPNSLSYLSYQSYHYYLVPTFENCKWILFVFNLTFLTYLTNITGYPI